MPNEKMVQEVATKKEFDEIINGDKVVVVDFTATWSGCTPALSLLAAVASVFPRPRRSACPTSDVGWLS